MGIVKHAFGEVIKDDNKKTSSGWSEKDEEELSEEGTPKEED